MTADIGNFRTMEAGAGRYFCVDDKGKLASTNDAETAASQAAEVRKLFLEATKSAGFSDNEAKRLLGSLPPGQPLKIEDLQAVVSALDRLMAQTESRDIGDILLILIEISKLGLESRKDARDAAEKAVEAQVGAINQQANHMITAAGWQFAGAIVSGAVGIGVGAVQVGAGGLTVLGGIISLKGSAGGAVLGGAGFKGAGKAVTGAADGFSKGLQGVGQSAQGVGQGANSAGGIAKGAFDYFAQLEQAEGTRMQAEATKAAADRETELKFRDNMQDILRSTREVMAQMIQSQHQAVSKVWS